MLKSASERATATSVTPRRDGRATRQSRRGGYPFVAMYALLLLVFGVLPTGYAIYLALTNSLGQFVGIGQFIKVAQDYRFIAAFTNIAVYVGVWLVVLVVLTVSLAIFLHQQSRYVSATLRFLFYLPGAMAGVATTLIWLFMLDPFSSPFDGLLTALGFTSFAGVIQPQNLTVIFVLMAFWTGAGGWIVVMYGALNNISNEVMDAARVDGASKWQLAWQIQIPMIGKWIAYMAILAFAAGTQLFVEPQLVATASQGGISPTWSPNELAYVYAFQNGDFNGAAALSIYLLLIGLGGALLLVGRSGLFTIEDER